MNVLLREKIKAVKRRLQLCAEILFSRQWNDIPFHSLLFHKEFISVTDEEIKENFRELEAESINEIIKYVSLQRNFYITEYNCDYFLYNHKKMYGNIRPVWKSFVRELKKYKFDTPLGGMESILLHHGLSFFPQKVVEYTDHGFFIDAGGCFGDSALVFLKNYKPLKVITFEPGKENCKIFHSNMDKNGIGRDSYELIRCGLGKNNETVNYKEKIGGSNAICEDDSGIDKIDIRTLDSFEFWKVAPVKFVKADVEGMGLDMLHGAEQTIRRCRPILSLSIYHNQDELFGIYKTLKLWELGYNISIRNLTKLTVGELTLLAVPEELL